MFETNFYPLWVFSFFPGPWDSLSLAYYAQYFSSLDSSSLAFSFIYKISCTFNKKMSAGLLEAIISRLKISGNDVTFLTFLQSRGIIDITL